MGELVRDWVTLGEGITFVLLRINGVWQTVELMEITELYETFHGLYQKLLHILWPNKPLEVWNILLVVQSPAYVGVADSIVL